MAGCMSREPRNYGEGDKNDHALNGKRNVNINVLKFRTRYRIN